MPASNHNLIILQGSKRSTLSNFMHCRVAGLGSRQLNKQGLTSAYLVLAFLLLLFTGGDAMAQAPLKILSAEEDLTAGTLLITGKSFGPEVFDIDGEFVYPAVSLAGVFLQVQNYTPDTEIVAVLPTNIQPGTFLLEVFSSTEQDDFSVQIGGTSDTQLIVRGAEVDFDPSACQNSCDGTILISGLNLGSTTSFNGTVELFVPSLGTTRSQRARASRPYL